MPRIFAPAIILLLLAALLAPAPARAAGGPLPNPPLQGEGTQTPPSPVGKGAGGLGPLSPLKIMPLGDSITTGTGDWPSYRYWLYKSLLAAGYSVDFVGSVHGQYGNPPVPPPACCQDFDWDEEGHSGWRADQILNGAPPTYPTSYKLSAWVQDYQPDIVLVHIGTNDLYQSQSVSSTRDEIGAIIDTIRQYRPNAIILLAQIIPARDGDGNLVTTIPTLNALLPALVASKQQANSPLVLVDQYTGFDVDADTHEGTHPNESGEKKMAARWLAAMPPAGFAKTRPANATTTLTHTLLSWAPSYNAASYEVCYDTTSGSTCEGAWANVGASTSLALSGLSVSTTYYWQVRAVNPSGSTSADDGAWWSFTPVAAQKVYFPLARR